MASWNQWSSVLLLVGLSACSEASDGTNSESNGAAGANTSDAGSGGASNAASAGSAGESSGSAGSGAGGSSGVSGSGTGGAGSGSAGSGSASPVNCEDPTGLEGCVAAMAAKGGGTVVLAEQTYLLTKSLILKDNVAIEGQGSKTVITWDDSVKGTIDEALLYTTKVEGVSLKNFSLACTIDQSPTSSDLRNDHIGLYFECGGDPTLDEATNCNDLSLEKLEVAYCSHGIHIKGATGVSALDLNLHDNGNTEVDFFHNIYLRRVADIVMKQSSPTSGGFYDSPRGHGIRISYLRNAYFEGLAVYGNADHGVHFAERIQNVRMNSMNIHDNCANPNGSCHETFCYGTECEIDYDAPKEP